MVEDFIIDWSEEQKEAVQKAAASKGQTVSQYLLTLASIDAYEEEPKCMLRRIGVKEFNEIIDFKLVYEEPFCKSYEAKTDKGVLNFEIHTMADGSRRSKLTYHDPDYKFNRNVNLMAEY